jgi:sulfopyruvate decarboxylase TPP-binding subunit
MKKNGITHVLWLPDSETNWLYTLMKAEPSITLVPVAREGLAFSAAAGVHAGGGRPIILIQNTGLLESGDSLRGWGLGLDTPVTMIIGYRGYTRHGVNTDTVADFTEPMLMAFGIKYYLIERDSDSSRISTAIEESRKKRRPVAVLVGDEYHGFNAPAR